MYYAPVVLIPEISVVEVAGIPSEIYVSNYLTSLQVDGAITIRRSIFIIITISYFILKCFFIRVTETMDA